MMTDKNLVVSVACDKCNGSGQLVRTIRAAEDLIAACRLPRATQNEIDAAEWIERLLAERTDSS